MTTDEILKSLCYYDRRNPNSSVEDEPVSDQEPRVMIQTCYCDNCFYGRTKLAEELLKYIPK